MKPDFPAQALAFDPRCKILLALLAGFILWEVSLTALIFSLVLFLMLFAAVRTLTPHSFGFLRPLALFVLFWAFVKTLVDVLFGDPLATILPEVGLLSLRLSTLFLLGICLTLVTPSRQLGLAFAWFSFPLLRSRAWKVALALSLMIHFLPLSLSTITQVRQSIAHRCAHLRWYRRIFLLSFATLRTLAQKTWDQTLAIISRQLDRPQAWEATWNTSTTPWFITAGLALGLVLLLFIP